MLHTWWRFSIKFCVWEHFSCLISFWKKSMGEKSRFKLNKKKKRRFPPRGLSPPPPLRRASLVQPSCRPTRATENRMAHCARACGDPSSAARPTGLIKKKETSVPGRGTRKLQSRSDIWRRKVVWRIGVALLNIVKRKLIYLVCCGS